MESAAPPEDFYDELAASYHLIFEDWGRSIALQSEALSEVISGQWGKGVRRVLDVACGIGTQTIALAGRGFDVTASDISKRSVERARQEAQKRGLAIKFAQGDMRTCHDRLGEGYDLVIACDNAIPHLLTDSDILTALSQMRDCLRPQGGLLISVRDYNSEPRGRGILKPYGVREVDGRIIVVFQVWDFAGDQYDLSLYLVDDSDQRERPLTRAYRTRYYAISIHRMCALMRQAGFARVKRIDDALFQPVLVGTSP